MKESFVFKMALTLALGVSVGLCAQDDKKAAKTISINPAEMGGGMPEPKEIDFVKAWAFIPEVVATVGDQKITKAELVKSLKPMERQATMMAQMGREMGPAEYKKMAKMMADELVDIYVLVDLASKTAGKPTKELGEQKFKELSVEFAKQVPPGQKMTLEDMIKKQGLNPEDEKMRMAQIAVIEKWIEKDIKPQIKAVDEAEAKAFYDGNKEMFLKGPEKVRASHILIPFKGATRAPEDITRSKEDAKKLAESLLKEIKGGADFAAVAKKNSSCPSKEKGGDLDYFGKGQMTPEFEKAAFGMKNGEVSDVVETPFGFHIIKTTDHKAVEYASFDEVKAKLIDQLQTKKEMEKLNEIKTAEKAKMKIVNNLDDAKK